MKIIPICGVLVWATITAAICAPNQRVALAGFYYIENVKMVPFAIEAIMNPYNPKDYPNIHSGRYIGTDGGVPSHVCSAFAVSIGGREIRIPKKAYSDLEDILIITRMEREDDVNRWSAKIIGGSGAGSYELEFIFDSERLLERRFIQSEPETLLGENMPKSARRNHFNEMILSTEKY
jgi:hypothetical protein